jgi:hypothetical protein
MPLSTDPDKRARQLANLQPAAAIRHGVTSERELEPLRVKHRAELRERFGRIDEHRLTLLSNLLARLDLAHEYVDVHGLMRNTRQAHPVLALLERWEQHSWRMLSELQPIKQAPVETPEPIRELLDPEVQRYSHALLRAINCARMRSQGHAVDPRQEPPALGPDPGARKGKKR